MGAPAVDTSAENMARRGGKYWLVTRLRDASASDVSVGEASASDVSAGNAYGGTALRRGASWKCADNVSAGNTSVRRGISWIFVI